MVFAFAASNTVPQSSAGDGAGLISGYAVSGVKYNLNAADPQNIDSINFTLTTTNTTGIPATSSILARIVNTQTFMTCSFTGGGSTSVAATCPSSGTTGQSALIANTLQVVAADK